jgi:hypothetical protein
MQQEASGRRVVPDLGINSDAIKYEVALEVLGQSLQPFARAIEVERSKAQPSAEFIRYCEMRMKAIDELQDELKPEDRATIDAILDPKNPLFRAS